jgi:S1-C subfamily serine protease
MDKTIATWRSHSQKTAELARRGNQEVTADKVKELKLSAERGVLLGKVLEDSPAAKSGLKDGDVVTEINGQRRKEPRNSAG